MKRRISKLAYHELVEIVEHERATRALNGYLYDRALETLDMNELRDVQQFEGFVFQGARRADQDLRKFLADHGIKVER